jgi:hypothetical protein
MMIAVAVVALGTWALAQYRRLGFYYFKGWWEAECELWKGAPTIYGGLGSLIDDICRVDQATGLPIAPVCGCVVQVGERERVRGHDDHIAQYIRWHGLPRNSYKRCEAELFHLKRFFDARSQVATPEPLLVDGPALVSLDRSYTVRRVADFDSDGRISDSLKLVFTAGNVMVGAGWCWFGEHAKSDLLWGPPNSRFAVTRSISGTWEHYEAWDLKSGWSLRDETWHDGIPCPPQLAPGADIYDTESDVKQRS